MSQKERKTKPFDRGSDHPHEFVEAPLHICNTYEKKKFMLYFLRVVRKENKIQFELFAGSHPLIVQRGAIF